MAILADFIRYQCETFRGRCGHLLPASAELFTCSVEELYVLLNQCHQHCQIPPNANFDQLVKQACPRDVDLFSLLDRQPLAPVDNKLEKMGSAIKLLASVCQAGRSTNNRSEQ